MSPARTTNLTSVTSNTCKRRYALASAGDDVPVAEVCLEEPMECIKRLYAKRGDRFAWQLFYRLKKQGWEHWDLLEVFIQMVEDRYLNAPAHLLWKLWNSKKLRANLTERIHIDEAEQYKECPKGTTRTARSESSLKDILSDIMER